MGRTPYLGMFETPSRADTALAYSMMEMLGIAELARFEDPKSWFVQRDAIKQIIATTLATKPTDYWLAILEPADIWCAKVLDWPELMASEGFQALDMLQTVTREDNVSITTTRSPLRVNGERARTHRAAPLVGEQSARIRAEFGL